MTNWVEVPPPVLALDPAGAVRWGGVPGVAYRVEASVNLTAWETVGTVRSATGDCVFPYAPAPAAAQYFRVGAP